MKRYILYLLISMCGFYGTAQIIQTNQKLDSIMNEQLASKLRSIGIFKAIPENSSADDIVKWLLETLGGLITCLVMFFLHRWFPSVFPSGKPSYYKQRQVPSGNGTSNKKQKTQNL